MPVIRKPERTKKRSTPDHPSPSAFERTCGIPGGREKWYARTARIATPRTPSNSGITRFMVRAYTVLPLQAHSHRLHLRPCGRSEPQDSSWMPGIEKASLDGRTQETASGDYRTPVGW